MDKEQQILFDRILAFDIDGGPRNLSFAARLARENHWSLSFANRVIEEYKRFVFLTIASGHPCTPSDEVDQAWHLHLSYTKSYWDRFCGGVLHKPLHHNPTEGGGVENSKFDDWYNRTLQSYRQMFGAAPPFDIWPPASVRFGEDAQFERVNVCRNWIFPKLQSKILGIVLLIGALVTGCGAAGGISDGVMAILVIAGAALLVFLVYLIGSRGQGNMGSTVTGDNEFTPGGCGVDSSSGCGSGCGAGGCGSSD